MKTRGGDAARTVNALVFRLEGAREPWAALLDEADHLSVTLGRGTGCDLPLPPGTDLAWTVSRRHARLMKRGGAWYAEDLNAKNLTCADGRLVLAPRPVSLPCTLRLGEVTVVVTREALPRKAYQALLPLDPPPWVHEATGEFDPGVAAGEALVRSLRAELRDARLFELLAEGLAPCRRVELAEERARQVLAVYLGANEADLATDLAREQLEAWLEHAGCPLPDGSVLPGEDGEAGDGLCHVTGPVPGSHAWVACRDGQAAAAAAHGIDTANFPDGVPAAVLQRFLGFTARHAGLLREAEVEEARAPVHGAKRPSEDTLALAREAGFHGIAPASLDTLYAAERIGGAYLRSATGTLRCVCLLGESGVGKSHLARLLHALSAHAAGPFIAENCANIQETLAESSLFGHASGAYTGAEGARTGFFELAHGGTLFLDEIANMSLAVQAKLLTVLDSGRFRQTGANEERQTDCFVLLATNRNPEDLCREGLLRQDLWFRIQTAVIHLAPLRERPGDIPELCRLRLDQLARDGAPLRTLAPDVLRRFAAYAWPGNVRELLGSVEAASLLCDPVRSVIQLDDLPPRLREALGLPNGFPRPSAVDLEAPLEENVKRIEREYLVRLLAECGGVKTRMADHAQVSHQTVYNKLAEFRAWLPAADPDELARLRELAGTHWTEITG